MSAYLTFGELNAGDRFIGLPQPGDDGGHGGFKGPHYIFQKIEGAGRDNAMRQKDGILSCMPDSMPIIKVE